MKKKYQVSDRCITCNTCVSVCPTGAIGKGELYYVIDQSICMGCGICKVKCTGDAIDEIEE